jgi:hypothetical protein
LHRNTRPHKHRRAAQNFGITMNGGFLFHGCKVVET